MARNAAEHSRDPKVAPSFNTYEGIAQYYDLLMTKGYYDYSKIAHALHHTMTGRRRVMELGVGTGLLAEELLRLDPAYRITGIDNTESMIAQAKSRLGNRIEYQMQDITQLTLEERFEAAFSVGGCWYVIDSGPDTAMEMCSHIDDAAASRRGLERVVDHLKPGGIISFALQGAHTNYSKDLGDDLVYSQNIVREPSGFTKHYRFERAGEVVGTQDYRYLLLSMTQCDELFSELGCQPIGLDDTRHFFSYRKD